MSDLTPLAVLALRRRQIDEAERAFQQEMREAHAKFEAASEPPSYHHQWRIAVERRAQLERITASEQVRALEAELRRAMKWYPRWKWTAVALCFAVIWALIATAVVGWRG